MSRQERYGTRDLRFSAWHRSLEGDLDWIDLDYCGFCHGCKRPLFLMELAQDVGQEFKPTTVTRNLARMADIPALLVFYTANGSGMERFRVQLISPRITKQVEIVPATMEQWIRRQHQEHICQTI
jgi:hypothetical protein